MYVLLKMYYVCMNYMWKICVYMRKQCLCSGLVFSLVIDISCLIVFQLHAKMNARNSPRLPHCLTLNIKIILFFFRAWTSFFTVLIINLHSS